MRAMILDAPGTPLRLAEVPPPIPGPRDVLVRVHACAVCRTDLHVVDGELPPHKLPLIPGHQIAGTVIAVGSEVSACRLGDRVGISWLGRTCGRCRFCIGGQENLCEQARFTGYDLDGGYAEMAVADEHACLPIPERYADLQAAPLLCAGLIGYRAYRMTGDASRLAFFGFGAAAHILIQVAIYHGRTVFAFTRPGDLQSQSFARRLGAAWAGDSTQPPPEPCDAAIIFAPAGELVPLALQAVVPGGVVVCAGIHMSDIPSFRYEILFGERTVRSVANLTRRDGEEFLALAPKIPVRTQVRPYPLEEANAALRDLREWKIDGAAVLVPEATARDASNAKDDRRTATGQP
jgi:alcohol dehydrogenase, propanol-preferring